MGSKLFSNRTLYIYTASLCCLTLGIYYPGLQGDFYFDDYPNIVNNFRLHLDSLHISAIWEASWTGITGHFKRPISILSFSLNTYFTDLNPGPMKITNLIIHLLCGIGIILLSRLLIKHWFSKDQTSKINLISLTTGALWLIHPLQLTSVLYIVQRMTSLSSLLSVCAIISYCLAREKMFANNATWIYFFPVLIFGSLSTLSKEIGLLLPLFLLCIELFIFKFKCFNKKDKIFLQRIFILLIIVPITIFCYHHISQPKLFLNYNLRDFTLTERILTETRIVAGYLKTIISPNINELYLFKENIEISKSLVQPISTFFSLALVSVLLIIAAISYKKSPHISFGISWFFVGHLLESTIFPLELYFEHRNYLPSFGIFLATAVSISKLASKINKEKYIFALFLCWLTTLASVTFIRANLWEDELSLALYDVERAPQSPRANMIIGSVYQNIYFKTKDIEIKNDLYNDGIIYFHKAEKLQPNSIAPTIAKSIFTCSHLQHLDNSDLELINLKILNTKIGPEPLNAITLFSKYVINGQCNIPSNDYLNIMYSALNNPWPSNNNEALILINLAIYHSRVLNENKMAISLAKEAVTKNPSYFEYRIELSKLMLLDNDYEGALNEINNLQKIDKYGTYSDTINKILRIINNHKTLTSREISS